MYQIFCKSGVIPNTIAEITKEERETAEAILWREKIRKDRILKKDQERKEGIKQEYEKRKQETETYFGFRILLLILVGTVSWILWCVLPCFQEPMPSLLFFFFMCAIILSYFFKLKNQYEERVKWNERKEDADLKYRETKKRKELFSPFPAQEDYNAFYDPDTYDLMAFSYYHVLYVSPDYWHYLKDAEESVVYLVFRKNFMEKVSIKEEEIPELVSGAGKIWLPVSCRKLVAERLADLWLF